ncbi:response regulator transcription factor [Flavobacterium sp. CYK-4]|uniref:response regulator transcription factor n=1 Tax=Flavobacterium lotistagni TaxID=2709660 RepID=UPI00140B03B4|nr:response regulator transcription factor [Flavobacterium lotistagni]NHM06678.1 response regulator transcription factor [Flavobacterium lotistagni]
MKRKICLVEDDRDLREALCLMLQYTENYQVISAFQNAEEALQGIPLLQPDAVLMDINLPGENGIECVRKLKWQFPKLLFMMCTSFEEDEVIFESLKAGASGYILKTDGPAKIIKALDELFDGGSPMTSSIARKVVASFSRVTAGNKALQELTPREREILDSLARGKMNKEVAADMDISVGTVRKHIQHIYEKLHVNTRVEAVNLYLKR